MSADDNADGCGCAPTEREKRALWPASVNRRSLLRLGMAAGAVALVGVGGPMLPRAFAADYPSWDDVEAAKANEASKAAEIQRIGNEQGLVFGTHYLPHDSKQHSRQTGKTDKQLLEELMPTHRFDQVERTPRMMTGIQQTRAAMASAWTQRRRCFSR